MEQGKGFNSVVNVSTKRKVFDILAKEKINWRDFVVSGSLMLFYDDGKHVATFNMKEKELYFDRKEGEEMAESVDLICKLIDKYKVISAKENLTEKQKAWLKEVESMELPDELREEVLAKVRGKD